MNITPVSNMCKIIPNKNGFTKLAHDAHGNKYLGIYDNDGKLINGIIQSPIQYFDRRKRGMLFTRISVNQSGEPVSAKLVRLFCKEHTFKYKKDKNFFAIIMRNKLMKNFLEMLPKFSVETPEELEKIANKCTI